MYLCEYMLYYNEKFKIHLVFHLLSNLLALTFFSLSTELGVGLARIMHAYTEENDKMKNSHPCLKFILYLMASEFRAVTSVAKVWIL